MIRAGEKSYNEPESVIIRDIERNPWKTGGGYEQS
jgi:hypothetical protein